MEEAEDPIYIESAGSAAGVNPFFGEWRRKFRFSPVAHTAKAQKRSEFCSKVKNEIRSEFLFIHEIKVDITLHLDQQRMEETDETADLDNFAKCILDCLKGRDGIFIDDCQVQSLHISWIDIYDDKEWFEVEIRSHPDEFMLKDVRLYEMPNGLWYPISNRTWDNGSAKELDEGGMIALPLILDAMTGFSNRMRAKLRSHGRNRNQAYREAKYHNTLARGFHKSRVEADFELVPMKAWRPDIDKLAATGPEKARKVYDILADFKKGKDDFIEVWERILNGIR